MRRDRSRKKSPQISGRRSGRPPRVDGFPWMPPLGRSRIDGIGTHLLERMFPWKGGSVGDRFMTPSDIPFLLVSDFDDTLKISHTTNRLKTVLRGLFTKQAYAGMSELYQEWVDGRSFVVISSSPNAIRGKID